MSSKILESIQEMQKTGEIEDLILDEETVESISEEEKKAIEKLDELLCISLNNCGLKSLKNFPNSQNLIRVELNNNEFPAQDLVYLEKIENLQSLSLSGNDIKQISDLEPLKKFEDLVQLDLVDCPISSIENYRDQVFEYLENLQILDNIDIDGNEIDDEEYSDEEEEEEEGEYDESEEESEEDTKVKHK